MSLKPYPEYKDSGQQWLGEIPSHWKIVPLWTLFRRTKTLGTGSEILLSVYRDYGVVPKKSRNDNFNKASEDLSKYQLVGVGDLVINKMKAWQGSVAISELSGIVSPAYFVFKALSHIHSRFAHFLMRSTPYSNRYAAISSGVRPNQWDLDPAQHRATPILLPPPHEQQDIADYLDRETAEIDAFIADQEQLIALLVERRTATITQAVARGLHPDVRMVAGRLAEIGSVPIHWSVSRLKWGITKIESGTSVNAHDIPVKGTDEVGVLKTSCVYTGEFDPSKNKKVNVEDLHRVACPVQANTLIVSRMNTPQLVGAAGYVVRNEPNIYLPDRLWQVYFHESWEARFVHFWTQTRLYRAQVEAVCMGTSSSMQNIGQDDLRNFILHLPPKDEQREIVDYLKSATSDIDAAIADAREAIALSQERRAAVISAAVTGKIDVRGFVGPEANDVEVVSVGIA